MSYERIRCHMSLLMQRVRGHFQSLFRGVIYSDLFGLGVPASWTSPGLDYNLGFFFSVLPFPSTSK